MNGEPLEKGTLIRMCVLNLLNLIKKNEQSIQQFSRCTLVLQQGVAEPENLMSLLSFVLLFVSAEFVQMMTAKWSPPAPLPPLSCPLLEENKKSKKKKNQNVLLTSWKKKMFIYSYCFCIENNWMLK